MSRKKNQKTKRAPKTERIKQSPLKGDALKQVLYYIAKGHHVKYACILGGLDRRTFDRWLDDAAQDKPVKYATPEEQEELLKDVALANAMYIDNRLDALESMKNGNLAPSVFKQIQWELAVKDSSIYSHAATTKLEITKQSNPLLEVWQSILNQREDNEENEDDEQP